MQHKIGQNLSPFASVYGWGKPTYTVHVYTFAIVHIFSREPWVLHNGCRQLADASGFSRNQCPTQQ